MKSIFQFMFCLNCLLSAAAAQAKESILSKKDVYQKLQSGTKWSLTKIPALDANAKLQQAQAASQLHVELFSRQAAMKTNPITLGLNEVRTIDTIGFGSTGLAAEFEILNLSHSAQEKAAEINQKIGAASSSQYQNDLSFLCLLKYTNIQQEKLKIAAADYTIGKDEDLLKLISAKAQVGAGTSFEVARAQALLEKDKLKKLEIESRLQEALMDLEDLIGSIPESTSFENLSFSPVAEKKINELANSEYNQPELSVNEQSLLASHQLVNIVKNEKWPTISVYAQASSVGTQALGLINEPTGAIGIQIKMPLYDGGYSKGRIAEAMNKVQYLSGQANILQESQKRKVNLAKFKMLAGEKAVLTSQKAMDLAKKELSFAEKKVRIGSGGSIDYINAQNNLASAMDLHIQALWGHEMAKINFFHLIANLDGYFEATGTKETEASHE